jgi:hypothetical protein
VVHFAFRPLRASFSRIAGTFWLRWCLIQQDTASYRVSLIFDFHSIFMIWQWFLCANAMSD